MRDSSPGPALPFREGIHRRGALKILLLAGWGTFAAAAIGAGAAVLRFFASNDASAVSPVFKAGRPEDIREGEVREDFKRGRRVYLVRSGDRIFALSAICTHLGCTTNWLSSERKFKCPCHGTGFRPTGENFEGPAPRSLERFRVTFSDDGQILVDMSRSFRRERGEWDDPDSFLRVEKRG
ncbi:MAG: Rieske 2Fe-2S domain-containing protein [Planctomycetota bacterium]